MGYQINSTWTKLREKDINKLNKIIDDEYCIELEIGRKLNLMEKFNKAFNEAIKNFNFDIVIKFMKDNNWKWFHSEDGKDFYEVPTRSYMIDRMKEDFLKHGLYEIIELDKTSYGVSSGGIVFEMNIVGNECYVEIYFDISHFKKN